MAEDQEGPLNKVDDANVLILSQCATCALKWADAPRCDAYPLGIPLAVLLNQQDHSKPIAGDLGLQWVPAYDGAKREAREL